jgi:C-terminal processing protease CtpA/Prc
MSRTLPSPRVVSRSSEVNPSDSRKVGVTAGSGSPPVPADADYVGVGIVFDANMRVLNLVKGGAAERSNSILRYDLLVAVDVRSMAAASTDQLKAAVRGPSGAYKT